MKTLETTGGMKVVPGNHPGITTMHLMRMIITAPHVEGGPDPENVNASQDPEKEGHLALEREDPGLPTSEESLKIPDRNHAEETAQNQDQSPCLEEIPVDQSQRRRGQSQSERRKIDLRLLTRVRRKELKQLMMILMSKLSRKRRNQNESLHSRNPLKSSSRGILQLIDNRGQGLVPFHPNSSELRRR